MSIGLLSFVGLLFYTIAYLSLFYSALHYTTLHNITLHGITLPHLTFTYLTSPYIASPYLTLPYFFFSYLNLSLLYLTLPYLTSTLPYPTLPYPTLPYNILPYLIIPYPTIPCLTSPHLTSSRLISSYHFLSCLLGTYLFIESSSPRSRGEKARLVSEQFNSIASTTRCLTFWYHMYGANIGKLNIIYKTPTGANTETLLWNLTGQQQTSQTDAWRYASVPVSSNTDHSVSSCLFQNASLVCLNILVQAKQPLFPNLLLITCVNFTQSSILSFLLLILLIGSPFMSTNSSACCFI